MRTLVRGLCVVVVAAGLAVPSVLSSAGATTYWQPTADSSITWNWQLQGTVPTNTKVQMFDIDGFDNTTATVAALHAQGTKVICYIDVGSWENWRSDASSFPASVLGATYSGFSNERWLDIRQWSILGPIMTARFTMAQQKGCDGIEPDNVDGYDTTAHESTGFPLTYADQITYNEHIADVAHSLGMSVGLKNDINQTTDLVSSFDWALTEQCNEYGECGFFKVFTNADKAVFNAEYSGGSTFCPADIAAHINGVRYDNNLDGKTYAPCGGWTSPTTTTTTSTTTTTTTSTTTTVPSTTTTTTTTVPTSTSTTSTSTTSTSTTSTSTTTTTTTPITATAISGVVTDAATSAPIANVCVYLYAHGGARTTDPGVCTDGAGKYTLPVAAAGSYDVAFIDSNGTHPTTWSGNVSTQGGATAVAVTAGHTSTLNLVMPEITAITGTVTDSVTSAPIANVCVYLYAHGGARTGDVGVCSDTQGKYQLPVAAAGSYDVAFIDSNGTHPTTWSGNVSTQGGATAVAVTANHLTTENVTMPEITAITGTVTDSVTSAPIANVCVYLYAHGGARTGDVGVCSDAQGKYQLPVAAAGSYDLAFIDSNGTHPTTWSGNVSTQGGATAVAVTANQLTTENVTMPEITAITGTVTDSVTSAPIANVCVYLYAHGGARTTDPGVCTGADGTYVLPVATAGSYDVAFIDTGGTHATQWETNQYFQPQANAVTVIANQLTQGTNAALQPYGAISGTVTGTGNTATCVYADYASGPNIGQYAGIGSCTDSSGDYTLTPILPGLTYKIGFYPPGKVAPTDNWYNAATSEATATPVTVNAGQTTTGINNANH